MERRESLVFSAGVGVRHQPHDVGLQSPHPQGHLSLLHSTRGRAAGRGQCGGWGPSAIPVHGELSDESHIRIVRSRLILIVQEVQVGPVDGETLSPKLIT